MVITEARKDLAKSKRPKVILQTKIIRYYDVFTKESGMREMTASHTWHLRSEKKNEDGSWDIEYFR